MVWQEIKTISSPEFGDCWLVASEKGWTGKNVKLISNCYNIDGREDNGYMSQLWSHTTDDDDDVADDNDDYDDDVADDDEWSMLFLIWWCL